MPGTKKAVLGKQRWLEMDQKGIIQKIKPGEPTTWSSALHLVPKDGEDLRVCSDFRPLNNLTVLDHYPLPNLRSFTSKIAGSRLFSKLDLKAAYFQIPLSPSAQAKTITLSPWGAWKYLRLPMGLRNAAQSLQKMMDHILGDLEGVYVYMDDILCFTKTENEHLALIEEIFKRLDDNGLAIHKDKCLYQKTSLDFLGFHVSANGISPLKKKVDAITSFPAPRTPKDLLGFLGALNYYRRSLPKYKGENAASILQPLYDIATQKVPGKKFSEIWKEKSLDVHYEKAKNL